MLFFFIFGFVSFTLLVGTWAGLLWQLATEGNKSTVAKFLRRKLIPQDPIDRYSDLLTERRKIDREVEEIASDVSRREDLRATLIAIRNK